MNKEWSQAELDEYLFGKQHKAAAVFYTEKVLDPTASKAARQRIEKDAVYVHITCPRENVDFRRPATEQDFRQYPQAYQAYMQENAQHEQERSTGCAPIGRDYPFVAVG